MCFYDLFESRKQKKEGIRNCKLIQHSLCFLKLKILRSESSVPVIQSPLIFLIETLLLYNMILVLALFLTTL